MTLESLNLPVFCMCFFIKTPSKTAINVGVDCTMFVQFLLIIEIQKTFDV